MRKNVSVYSYDANPRIDPPVFYITRSEADVRIDRGYAVWLGPKSIETHPPGWSGDESKLAGAGIISDAWKPRWSDRYLVLQLVPQGS
jgi:hypothetical protein